jgi:hypothetical protein
VLIHPRVDEPMNILSSSLTFFNKFIFTTVWTVWHGAWTVKMFSNGEPARWVVAAMSLLGTAYIWWTCAGLKRVAVNGRTLTISNYRDDITVHATDIATVAQNHFVHLAPVTLTFKKDTPFGRAVTFMAPVSFRFFSEDDVVWTLRRLVSPEGDGPT